VLLSHCLVDVMHEFATIFYASKQDLFTAALAHASNRYNLA